MQEGLKLVKDEAKVKVDILLWAMQEGLYNDADFQSLTPMELVSKTVPELRAIIQDRRERREEERHQMMERLAQVGHTRQNYISIMLLASLLGLISE